MTFKSTYSLKDQGVSGNKEVFCCNCKSVQFERPLIFNGYVYSGGGFMCTKNEAAIVNKTPMRVEFNRFCNDINKNNDCQFFEEKQEVPVQENRQWWRFWG